MKKFLTVCCALALLVGATLVAATGWAPTLKIVTDILPVSVVRVTPGPLATYLSTYPAYLEFQRTGWGQVKGSVGALGSPEMNIAFNMDYATGLHRPYDPTVPANWFTINGGGYFCQYMPANPPVTNGSSWDATGNQLLCAITPEGSTFAGALRADTLVLRKAVGRVVIPAGRTGIVVRHAKVTQASLVFTTGSVPSTAAVLQGGFRVDLDGPAAADVVVGYLIVSGE